MNWHEKIIRDAYDGNSQRFDADYAEAVEIGRMHRVAWDDLLTTATTLPNLETAGRDLIERRLGYLPSDSTIIPFEPFLRALIQNYQQGQLSEEDFYQQTDEHIKLIRNQDMRYNTCLKYDAEIYQNYHDTFVPYGYAIRARLTWLLGYEPHLDYSLIAEMWMREVIARDTIQLPEIITPVDWKAMTLIKYREVLLAKGQASADASPLLRVKYL